MLKRQNFYGGGVDTNSAEPNSKSNILESKASIQDTSANLETTPKSLQDSIPQTHTSTYHKNLDELEFEYDWILIELFDQMVRMQSGGQMGKCFADIAKSGDKTKADFIKMRVGEDLLNTESNSKIPLRHKLTKDKIFNKILSFYLKGISKLIPRSIRSEVFIQTSIGERHKWLYDSFSLPRLLENAGFRDIEIVSFNQSSIPNFNDYLLDINADGSPYKGVSSIYVEGRK